MELKQAFEEAAREVQKLSKRPSNDVLLKLYALYKQGSEGDVSGDRPSGFDFKGAAKYDAWAKLKGKSKEEAQQAYVDLVGSLS